MGGRILVPATTLTLFAVLVLSACSSTRGVATSGKSPGEPAPDRAQAAEPATGREVTKDVPHSMDSIPDIQERGTTGPLPPRGDVAIPSHRILRGDNTVAPTPPAGAPVDIDKPGEPPPAGTGGY